MRSNLLKSLKLTLVFCLFFSVCYLFVLWGFAKIAGPNNGNPEVVMSDGRVVGVVRVGQSFTKDIYFWGRPSCAGVGYDASASGGSNKGATDPEYLRKVEVRIDTFLIAHSYLKREDIPAEMVTASGSGLDPEISKSGAYVQIKRVADARGMSEDEVKIVVDQQMENAVWGLFGPANRVNVLKLNVALDAMQKGIK
ncbi:MAG: K(+)-transporting ATPase subunit C [Odoribacter sp.]